MRSLSITPATAITVAAVLLVASSAAYAGGLKAGSVKARHLKPNAVTSAKVRDHTIRAADLAPGALVPGAAGATGPVGATGPTGPRGTARGTAFVNPNATVLRSTGVLEAATVSKVTLGYYCVDVPTVSSLGPPDPFRLPWVATAMPYPGFARVVPDASQPPYSCGDDDWAVVLTDVDGDPFDQLFSLVLL